jgi:acyl-coenzyme A thioesterase PaaI-like protein
VAFEPKDPDYKSRITASFSLQAAMKHLGITLARIERGEVELRFDYRAELTQQDGFIHAGIVGTAVDSACGYAALPLHRPRGQTGTHDHGVRRRGSGLHRQG